jgi:ammonia channel protein AmtB
MTGGAIDLVRLKLVAVLAPLRVSREPELAGLDITQHGGAPRSAGRSFGHRNTVGLPAR